MRLEADSGHQIRQSFRHGSVGPAADGDGGGHRAGAVSSRGRRPAALECSLLLGWPDGEWGLSAEGEFPVGENSHLASISIYRPNKSLQKTGQRLG